VVAHCDIHLGETVCKEASHFIDDEGAHVAIDLTPTITAQEVTTFKLTPSEIGKFRSSFGPLFLERIDPGEAEALAHLVNEAGTFLICSADQIVFRVLGSLGRADQGVSLEEVLNRLGFGRKLDYKFGRPLCANERETPDPLLITVEGEEVTTRDDDHGEGDPGYRDLRGTEAERRRA
jgi:hypothetical protein